MEFPKEEFKRLFVNFVLSPDIRPKDVDIKFVDVNGIELSGVAKVVIKPKAENLNENTKYGKGEEND